MLAMVTSMAPKCKDMIILQDIVLVHHEYLNSLFHVLQHTFAYGTGNLNKHVYPFIHPYMHACI